MARTHLGYRITGGLERILSEKISTNKPSRFVIEQFELGIGGERKIVPSYIQTRGTIRILYSKDYATYTPRNRIPSISVLVREDEEIVEVSSHFGSLIITPHACNMIHIKDGIKN
jgi:hypothetical protein